MPTLNEALEFRDAINQKARDLIAKKGHDYAGKDSAETDTFRNLRLSTIMGITETDTQSVMVRLCDKFMRLAQLTSVGHEAAVKDESLADTVADIYNYAAYALQLHFEAQEKTHAQMLAAINPDQSGEKRFDKQPS